MTMTNLQQRGEKEEIGIAEDGPRQHAVGANDFSWSQKSPSGFLRNFLSGLAAGTREMPKLVARPTTVQASKQEAGDGFAAAITLGENARGHGAADAREERAELDDAVAPGKLGLRQQLRQQAVFRRAEECAFGADQENAGAFQRQAA